VLQHLPVLATYGTFVPTFAYLSAVRNPTVSDLDHTCPVGLQ